MENKKTYVYAAKALLSAAARGGVLCFQRGVGSVGLDFRQGCGAACQSKTQNFSVKDSKFFSDKNSKVFR